MGKSEGKGVPVLAKLQQCHGGWQARTCFGGTILKLTPTACLVTTARRRMMYMYMYMYDISLQPSQTALLADV